MTTCLPGATPPASSYRTQRQALLEAPGSRGAALARELSAQANDWFQSAASTLLPPGWALLATAGYADGALCPGSDLDVLLVHPKRTNVDRVAELARELWYPFWDSGIKISPAVHSSDSVLKLGSDDLVTATTLLRLRVLAGDESVRVELLRRAEEQWRKNAKKWLAELATVVRERHDKAGEVAFLLEPNLKEGRGGLRDVHAIQWALQAAVDGLADGLVRPLDELIAWSTPLLDARVELHRSTGRTSDVLLLQDQDAVADRLGLADADELMSRIAESARTIAWASDRFWDHAARLATKTKRQAKPVQVDDGLVLTDDGLELTDDADLHDDAIILHVAASSARLGVLPTLRTLRRLANEAPGPARPWSDEVRAHFIELLDAGAPLVTVVEALDQHGLFTRVVPEWQEVRSRPQRNAYHTYTVDRHLLEAVVQAKSLVRQVHRPDLLVLGAFLHDIGKGRAGDHIETGLDMLGEMLGYIGVSPGDARVLQLLTEHHLLLAETATRRDVTDPGTAELIGRAVGDVDTLELLRALTEADSKATGPSAWSSWKAGLIDELVMYTKRHLGEHHIEQVDGAFEARHASSIDEARVTPGVHVRGDDSTCIVTALDRRGLFADVTGVLAAHGVEVVSADVWTSSDGVAVDEFRYVRRTGGTSDWSRIARDIHDALTGAFDIEARIDKRVKAYKLDKIKARSATPPRAEVIVDNETSVDATIVEVRAPDMLALLHRLSRLIAAQLLDIRHAKVATLGHEVVDVFYVIDTSGGHPAKLSEAAAEELRRSIIELLSEGAATAA